MRIGVDLGGTKIEALALDDDGRERLRRRVATPRDDAEAIVGAVAELVRGLEAELGQRCSVGIGTPGALSHHTGLLRNSNTTCLNGRPLDVMLGAALEREVRLANDANCFALSEARDGAAAGASVVFGVILGTGTGGWCGRRRTAAGGPPPNRGRMGSQPPGVRRSRSSRPATAVAAAASRPTSRGRGIARDHVRRWRRRAGRGDDRPSGPTAGDALAARATLDRYLARLGRALASVINLLDPDVVVLGGGLSNIGRLYRDLPAELARHVFSDVVDVPLRQARHGDSSGVRGAAWLWPRRTT